LGELELTGRVDRGSWFAVVLREVTYIGQHAASCVDGLESNLRSRILLSQSPQLLGMLLGKSLDLRLLQGKCVVMLLELFLIFNPEILDDFDALALDPLIFFREGGKIAHRGTVTTTRTFDRGRGRGLSWWRWDVVDGKLPDRRDRRLVQEIRDSLQQGRAIGCWDSGLWKFHGEELTNVDEPSVVFRLRAPC
jgi:hypothetical protein